MSIWDNIPQEKIARVWNNLNWWQRTHHKEGIEVPDTENRGSGVKVDLAVTLEDCEETMRLAAHDHRLRDDDE